ncbi:MAG: hypothetical protein JRN21_09740 [Nitrososphaerota archaeon]|nr:hypothetical protein [Nitrososphaerota archaeon]
MRVSEVIEDVPVTTDEAMSAINAVLAWSRYPIVGESYYASGREVVVWNLNNDTIAFSINGRRFTGKLQR